MGELNRIYADIYIAAKEFGKIQTDMVYGEGNPHARIMLVGEAPGEQETKLSRPFVGKAGKNLDEFLGVLGQQREDIYITNVVKFRPFKVSEKGRRSNRPPSKDEIDCMQPHLLREIETVAPDIVVTLGNVPLRAVLGQKSATIGEYHAKTEEVCARLHVFTLFPLYHPASIIYNRALAAVYQNDILVLKEYIDKAL